jgi:hypothetical protein
MKSSSFLVGLVLGAVSTASVWIMSKREDKLAKAVPEADLHGSWRLDEKSSLEVMIEDRGQSGYLLCFEGSGNLATTYVFNDNEEYINSGSFSLRLTSYDRDDVTVLNPKAFGGLAAYRSFPFPAEIMDRVKSLVPEKSKVAIFLEILPLDSSPPEAKDIRGFRLHKLELEYRP